MATNPKPFSGLNHFTVAGSVGPNAVGALDRFPPPPFKAPQLMSGADGWSSSKPRRRGW
jgi:hypothetical protein